MLIFFVFSSFSVGLHNSDAVGVSATQWVANASLY